MARWQPIPIAGGAYSDDARPWTCQDTVNYLPVPAEREGTRSPSILRSAPGYVMFCDMMEDATVRGLHNVEGLLLAVTGDTLYRVSVDGVATAIGTIPGVGRVTMAHNQITNGHEVVIANGQSGYLYKTTDGSFGQISAEAFPGFKAVDFVDGYIVGIEPAGRYWFHSDLLDAGKYSTLDRYDAEAAPDKVVAIIVSHREVMVLNDRSSQFFRNSGGDTGTFENNNGTEIEVGCASPHAVARLDNTVYWLGNDNAVYRLSGHNPQRISTGPIEQAISRCNAANSYAFTFDDRGHKVFYLTFPDGQTWGYDVWTGEWHRRRSQGISRWRLSDLVRWNGKWIGGDFSTGHLYRLDWGVQHEAGSELERRRVMAVMHDNQNPITISGLEVVFDSGAESQEEERFIPSLVRALVSWWPLTEASGTRFDASGPNHLSTNPDQDYTVITNGVAPPGLPAPSGIPGSGSAIEVSGSDDAYLIRDAGHCVGLDDQESYEIVSWVSAPSPNAGVMWAVCSKNSPADNGYYIGIGEDAFPGDSSPFGVIHKDYFDGFDAAPMRGDTSWQMVSGFRSGSIRGATVDAGQEVTQQTGVTTKNSSPYPFRLASMPGFSNPYAGSYLGQTAFFNRKLTAEERSWMFNGGLGRTYDDFIMIGWS